MHANEAHAPVLRHTNDVIANYVTAGGRIKLYTYLDTLQNRALYVETDSVLYIQPSDDAPLVTTGDRLSDMTSEINRGNTYPNMLVRGPKITRTERTIQRRVRR